MTLADFKKQMTKAMKPYKVKIEKFDSYTFTKPVVASVELPNECLLWGMFSLQDEIDIERIAAQRTEAENSGKANCLFIMECTNTVFVGEALPDGMRFGNTFAEVVLPESPLTIGKKAFMNFTALKSIDLKNVVKVNSEAFSGCTALESIVIPDSVAELEGYVFEDCAALQSVTLSKNMGYIKNNTFAGCTALESIVIPEGIKDIQSCSFQGCVALKTVTIPDSVEEISDSAFNGSGVIESGFENSRLILKDRMLIDKQEQTLVKYYCPAGATRFEVPTGMKKIGNEALRDCESLQEIALPDSLEEIGSEAFLNCKSLQSLVIPAGVKAIGDHAFRGCVSLKEITLPEGMKELKSIFYSCDSLTSVTVPEGVEIMRMSAFFLCKSLESVVLPKSLDAIEKNAFSNCPALKSVEIANPYIDIHPEAVEKCEALGKLKAPKKPVELKEFVSEIFAPYETTVKVQENYGSYVEGYQVLIKAELPNGCVAGGTFATFRGKIIDPARIDWEPVKAILKKAEENTVENTLFIFGNVCTGPRFDLAADISPLIDVTTMKKIVLAENITKVWSSLCNVYNKPCSALEEVVLHDGVTEIEDSAFEECTALKSIDIPASVKTIGDYAFEGCESLQSVNLPDGVTVGYNAFKGCPFANE